MAVDLHVRTSGIIFSNQTLPSNNQIAVEVTNQAICIVIAGSVENYTTAFVIGTGLDTSATQILIGGTAVITCTNDSCTKWNCIC